MPANTPSGWPYALPADNVADYPVTSQALATLLDSSVPYRMADGAGVISNPGNLGSLPVVFPAGRFTVPPIVMMTKSGGNGGGRMMVYTVSITAAGFTATAGATDGVFSYAGTIAFQWLAVQMGPTVAFSEELSAEAQAELDAALAADDWIR